MRRKLALGLQQIAEVVQRAVEMMTAEVAPDTGLLAAASGETAERIGLDSGLYPQLVPLYAAATAAGAAIQVGGWAERGGVVCRQRRSSPGEAHPACPQLHMRHMTLVPRLSYICPLPTRLWLQESHRLLEFAPLQFDMYRRQRRFPTHAFSLLTTVVRSTLTQAMMIGEQRSAAQRSAAQHS